MKDIIITPIITEKATKLSEELGVYSFKVGIDFKKIDAKKEIEKMFDVNVEDIKSMIYYRKSKSKYTKKGMVKGKTNSYKKILVKVKEGQMIDIYNV